MPKQTFTGNALRESSPVNESTALPPKKNKCRQLVFKRCIVKINSATG